MHPHSIYTFDPLRPPAPEDEAAAWVLAVGMVAVAVAAAGLVVLATRVVGGW